MNVLVVEGNQDHANTITEHLERAGGSKLNVEIRHKLADGLQRLGAGGIEVVMVDLNLADCKGVEAIARTAKKASQVPIVALCPRDDHEVFASVLRHGAQDILLK